MPGHERTDFESSCKAATTATATAGRHVCVSEITAVLNISPNLREGTWHGGRREPQGGKGVEEAAEDRHVQAGHVDRVHALHAEVREPPWARIVGREGMVIDERAREREEGAMPCRAAAASDHAAPPSTLQESAVLQHAARAW